MIKISNDILERVVIVLIALFISLYFINKDEIMISDICPQNITPFLENFNKKFYFSLERSVKFYKWRVDDYPLGKQKYFTKKKNNQTSSLLVSQILKKKA